MSASLMNQIEYKHTVGNDLKTKFKYQSMNIFGNNAQMMKPIEFHKQYLNYVTSVLFHFILCDLTRSELFK